MDFVVLGFGVGALAVLVGLGMRDLGPMLRRVPRGERDDLPWSEVARRVGWGRTCRSAGLVVTLSGAALCLLTLLILIAGAGDGFGMGAVLATLALALVVGAVWAMIFVRQASPGRAGVARMGGLVGDRRQRSPGARTGAKRSSNAPRTGPSSGVGAGRRRTAGGPAVASPDVRQRSTRSESGATPVATRPDTVDSRPIAQPPVADNPEEPPAEAARRRAERGR